MKIMGFLQTFCGAEKKLLRRQHRDDALSLSLFRSYAFRTLKQNWWEQVYLTFVYGSVCVFLRDRKERRRESERESSVFTPIHFRFLFVWLWQKMKEKNAERGTLMAPKTPSQEKPEVKKPARNWGSEGPKMELRTREETKRTPKKTSVMKDIKSSKWNERQQQRLWRRKKN